MQVISASAIVLVAAVSALAGCCAPAHRPLPVTESGFLTDYTLLAPSKDPNVAQYRYRNPDVDLSRYAKLMFQRVTIWVTTDKKPEEIASEDFQRLADDMYYTVRAALAPDYDFVDAPGPGVMRVHLALTYVSNPKAEDEVFLSVASPAPPAAGDDSELAPAAMAFVNNANIETELVDAETGRVVFAALDEWTRLAERERGSVKTWKQVHEVLAFWADRFLTGLARARRGEL